MQSLQPMEPKTAVVTIVIAFFMTTVVMGLGRAMIDSPVQADASRVAAIEISQ